MVESVKTFGNGAEYLHLINYSRETQTVTLSDHYQNPQGGATVSGQFELEPFGAAILKRI
jgi:beta-galactosidase GanA